MTFHIITIFPRIFDSYFSEGILRRAQEDAKLEIKIHNLRDFSSDKHKTVDDIPYGGGPGMVLKVEPIFKCVEHIISEIKGQKTIILLTSAKGRQYTQAKADQLKDFENVIIICGRYEGVDERVAKYIADEEISIGKYVLTGGEIPAMAIVDSVARLLEGVLGNKESLGDSKFELQNSKFEKDHPVYTRPEKFQSWKVPEVLLSGNHKEIERWRSKKQTRLG